MHQSTADSPTRNAHTSDRSGFFRAISIFSLYLLLYIAFVSPVLFSGRLLAPGDGHTYFYSMYHASRSAWTPNLFGGYPIFADPQAMNFYPPVALLTMLPSGWDPITWNVLMVGAYALASFFTCELVLAISGSVFGGLTAGIIFGLSGFMMAHLGHSGMIQTAVWLPLMLLAAVKLRRRLSVGWFAAGSVAIALSLLAGHGQIAVYSLGMLGCYVLVLGIFGEAATNNPLPDPPPEYCSPQARRREKIAWRYYGAWIAAGALGVGLAAVQLLPSLQLLHRSVRNALTYDVFMEGSLPWRQMSTLLYPFLWGGHGITRYIGPTNYGETAGYVGILALGLAGIAVWRRRKSIHTWFFLIVAVIAALLTTGEYGPLAWIMFHVPGYDLFRIPARHFFELTLAVAVLAGIGVGTLEKDTRRRQTIYWTAGAMLLLTAGSFWMIAHQRVLLRNQFAAHGITDWTWLPWRNASLGVPLLIALVSIAVMPLLMRPEKLWRRGIFLLILVAGLEISAYQLEWHMAAPKTKELEMPRSMAGYRQSLRQSHQRMVCLRGRFGSPDEGQPDTCFPWGLPSSGGYNPLVLQRYERLLHTAPDGVFNLESFTGSADAGEALPFDNRALDLLATRYLFAPTPGTARDDSADGALSLVFRSDSLSLADWQADVGDWLSQELTIVSAMGDSVQVSDGTDVAAVTVETAQGRKLEYHLRAGRDTAEQAWDRPNVKAVVRHRRAPIFSSRPADGYVQHFYQGRFVFPRPIHVRRIILHGLPPKGTALFVRRIALQTSGGERPITTANMVLRGSTRWRPIARSNNVEVYENRQTLPRAWLVGRVIRLSADQVAQSVSTGRLPDGGVFDPHKVALVEKSAANLPAPPSDAVGSARITALGDTAVEVEINSPRKAFLVLADVNYPGWKASIDSRTARIDQTDYLLRGLVVPQGRHTVRFVFRPAVLYAGAAVSGVSGLSLLLVIAVGSIKSSSNGV